MVTLPVRSYRPRLADVLARRVVEPQVVDIGGEGAKVLHQPTERGSGVSAQDVRLEGDSVAEHVRQHRRVGGAAVAQQRGARRNRQSCEGLMALHPITLTRGLDRSRARRNRIQGWRGIQGAVANHMTLSLAELAALQLDALADDVPIPPEATGWTVAAVMRYFESGGTIRPTIPSPETAPPSQHNVSRYEVIHSYVNIRSEPSVLGRNLGNRTKGSILEVDLERGGWARLAATLADGSAGWVLIDGSLAGIPYPLLRRVSGPAAASASRQRTSIAPPPSSAPVPVPVSAPSTPARLGPAEAAAPSHEATVELLASVSYEVAHRLVYVRDAPSRQGRELATLRKGAQVSASARCGDWIRLGSDGLGSDGLGSEAPATSRWMLVDGAAVGLGRLLKPAIKQLPPGTRWQVTRREGARDLFDSPAGSKLRDATGPCTGPAFGAQVGVVAECGLWAMLAEPRGLSAWVEMDVFFAG